MKESPVGSSPTLENTQSKPFCSRARIRAITLEMLCMVNLSSQSPTVWIFPFISHTASPSLDGFFDASSGI